MSEKSNSATDDAIDAVILWVDGSDKKLADKRDRYLALENKTASHPGSLPLRFASSDEISYCIRSVLTFAGFIRNIYVVTDEQDPNLREMIETRFPEKAGSLKIIDHKEIFRGYEQYLPTFNSSSIHTMIWRIEGLSDRFVYFNDDVILIREHREEDWFMGDRPVLMGKWLFPPYRRVAGNKLKTIINRHIKNKKDYIPKVSYYIRQWKSASALGFKGRYFFHDHTPHPFSKATFAEFFAANRDLLEKTISYRFRDPEQLLTSSLVYHREIQKGNRNTRRVRIGYFHPYYREKTMNERMERCRSDNRYKSVCIQNIEMLRAGLREKITGWIDSILD
ncbi:MAG: Stealth CR1 domain-containing protein [Actinomycetota bacterium]|jgi:hypothetical protein